MYISGGGLLKRAWSRHKGVRVSLLKVWGSLLYGREGCRGRGGSVHICWGEPTLFGCRGERGGELGQWAGGE